MALAIWNLKEIMDLLDARTLSVVLIDLQQYQTDCAEKKRRYAESRAPNLLLGEKRLPAGPDKKYLEVIIQNLKTAHDVCKSANWEEARRVIKLINLRHEASPEECDWSSLDVQMSTAIGCIVTAMWALNSLK